jgi:hypothetical protein
VRARGTSSVLHSGLVCWLRLAGRGTQQGQAGGIMDWLADKLLTLTLAGPAYLVLQLIMVLRYRGGWWLAAIAPMLLMVLLGIDAGLAYVAGARHWSLLLAVATPAAFIYLLLLAIVKARAASRQPRRAS